MTPSVFEFTDYRSFIVTHFEKIKSKNPRWSYQAWALKLGLKNNASLLKILNGQRDTGPKISQRLCEYFKFNINERIYFEDLVRLSKVKDDPRLSIFLMERLKQSCPGKAFKLLDERQFSVISRWWHYAIRQMVRLGSFQNDPEWISKQLRFKVTPREIKKAIDVLIELKLISHDVAKGTFSLSNESLNTSDDISSEALKQFHEGMLNNAREAIRSVPITDREISGCTISISTKNISKAKEFIRQFQDEFCRLFEEDGDAVYQVQTQFFPLTKFKKKGDL